MIMFRFRKLNYDVALENPISKSKDDIIGIESEVNRIKDAIKKGANLIGIVSDYGSGKSTMIEFLRKKLSKIRYRIVKINLWDEELSNNGENIKLHRSFLRQLSMNMYRFRPEYINRRLNANYGIAKISFPSYKNLIFWLIGYIMILFLSIATYCKYMKINIVKDYLVFSKVEFAKFIFSSLPFFAITFLIIFIIFNKEVLFSFWNSSKDRTITEEDTMQIYNEIIKPIIPFLRLKKIIIVIEDLDRISNPELAKKYINEFYRIYIEGNPKKYKSGITFVFCVKDEYSYTKSETKIKEIEKNDSKFLKIFDYISYIKLLNINDYKIILKQLIIRDKLLKKLATKNNKIVLSDFMWIIEGNDLNIRIIKNRLSYLKSLYLEIYNRGISSNVKVKPYINIKLCSFVSFVKSEFPNNLNKILKNYENGLNYIDRKIKEKRENDNKCANIDEYEKLLELESKNDKINDDLSDYKTLKVKSYFVELINDGIIDDDYQKYFYNQPKFSPVFNIYQKQLEIIIDKDIIPERITKNQFDNIVVESDTNDFLYNEIKKELT